MAKRHRSSLTVTAEQAHQALSFLVHQGKIAATEVRRALNHRERLIREIRERLAALGVGTVRVGGRVRRSAKAQVLTAGRIARRPRKRAKPISAARRAAMKAQGRYMAAIGRLPKASRAKIKVIRQKSGVYEAIAAAKRMGR